LDVASPLVLYESQGVESRELKRIYQGDSHER
jgi:hypothetical protein